jgi:hypothetical protein
MLEITGCSYFTQEHTSEDLPTRETPQVTTHTVPMTEESSLPPTKLEYEMELYTEVPNQDSSVQIQYPVFSGNKAEEINTLILTNVQDLTRLDTSYFPADTKLTIDYQSAVTLQNSKMISIVIWGIYNIEGSAYPTTNLYSLNIDLQSLEFITFKDLYAIKEGFEQTFFEKAFYPTDPATSYTKEDFSEMLKLQSPEYTSISPFDIPESIVCFLKPDGIVFSMPAIHATGSDHFEAEIRYSDIQDYYLPDQIYWEDRGA